MSFPQFCGWVQHVLINRQNPCVSGGVAKQHPGVALSLLQMCFWAKPIKFYGFSPLDTNSWLWPEGLERNGDFFLWSILSWRRGNGRKKKQAWQEVFLAFWLSRNLTRKCLESRSGYQGGLWKNCPGMQDWIRKVRVSWVSNWSGMWKASRMGSGGSSAPKDFPGKRWPAAEWDKQPHG